MRRAAPVISATLEVLFDIRYPSSKTIRYYKQFLMKPPTTNKALTDFICKEIAASGGTLSFASFMELALYTPKLGYYASTLPFGKDGDFVTSPEISPLFAKCIAEQCQAILTECCDGDIVEIGGGSGIFAKDILLALQKLKSLPARYFILEISATLRERQQELLQLACPDLYSRVIWIDTLPAAFNGIIFANEVLDALPTHCFRIEENGIKERCVSWNKDHFEWQLTEPKTLELTKQVEAILKNNLLPVGYESEINLMLPTWIRSLADALKKGVILLFDYGYGRAEYYHPDRKQGTLRCYFKHHAHDNPLIFVGLQDITAHVDFTTVIESAAATGLELAGFTTQTSFLLT